MEDAVKCKRHGLTAAGWRCEACGSALCPDCVQVKRFGAATIESCTLCGSAAHPIRVHRERVPYAVRLLDAWKFPLTANGLLALAGAAIVFHVIATMGWFLGALFVRGLELSYLLWLVRESARGAEEVTPPEFRHPQDDIVRPLLLALAASAYVWLPAVLYVQFTQQGVPLAEAFADPVVWLFAAAGAAYAPMAFIVAATHGGFVQMLNPVAVVAHMVRVGSDYALAVLASALLGVVWVMAEVAGAVIAATNVFVVSGWLGWIVALYVPFVWARAMGLLLYVKGDRVGFGRAEDYLEPVLGDTKPRGGEVDVGPQAVAMAAAEAQLLADDAPRVNDAVAGWETGGADSLAGGPPPDAASWAASVTDAIERGDMAGAVSLYRGLPEPARSPLSPTDHFDIGRSAATMGDYPLAARALRAAAESAPQHPIAPRALVVLARTHAERLGDAGTAAEIYRGVVERYPGTEAARFAQERLDAPPVSAPAPVGEPPKAA